MNSTRRLIFGCMLVPCVLYAQTSWYVAYEKALAAQDAGDWNGSIAPLKEAIAARERPGARAKTYGLRFVNYFPYFRLGEAYYHLHEKEKALENFDLCLKYGEIQQSPEEFALLQSHRSELSGGAPLPPPAVAAPAVQAGEGPPAPPGGVPPPVGGIPPLVGGVPWYVSYESALAYVESGDWLNATENLKLALAANGIPRRYARTYGMWFITYIPYFELGVCYYNQGMWQLAANYLETSDRLGEVNDLEPEHANLKTLLDEAKKAAGKGRRTPVSEELKTAVNTQIAEAVRLFNRDDLEGAGGLFRSVLRIDPYNSVAKNYLARISRHEGTAGDSLPPPAFSSGVLELLRGKYDRAIRLLKSAAPSMDQDASLHAYLGVAYCLRWRQRHKAPTAADRAALASAQSEFREALRIDPSYRLDPTLFAHDVVEIFLKVKAK